MLYEIGFFIFSIIYLPILVFKGKLHHDFAERFAIFDRVKGNALLSGRDRIWIQAVSVGEVALCKTLLPLLKERFVRHDIVISTITKAGNDLAKKIFLKDALVIYFPLDFGLVVKKAVRMIKPKLYIMIETEIWPNLLAELSKIGAPSILINGRISDRSVGKYRIVRPFLKKTLDRVSRYCMQDEIDAARIIELGAPSGRVTVTGNMKFDAQAPNNIGSPESICKLLGVKEGEDLLVAGSTHRGEEETLAETFRELSAEFPNLKLLIAPRHIDRVEEVEEIIKKSGLQSLRVSGLNEGRGTMYDVRILILDTIGHLNEAYSIATIVFMGGTLTRHGGHNPIEPALFGKPILFGPHMFNFKYITKVFLMNKAAIEITGATDFTEACRRLLKDKNMRSVLGDNAKKVVTQNRGAAKKNVEAMAGLF